MTDNLSTENTYKAEKEIQNVAHEEPHKENMLVNILANIVIPTIILTKFSDDTIMGHPWGLGAKWGLIAALAFPILYGIKDYFGRRTFNLFSALGIVSVLLTGGISLLQLPTEYYAIKAAAIPLLIGIVFIAATRTQYSLVKMFLYSAKILHTDKIDTILTERNNVGKFEKVLTNASYIIAISYFFCGALNYVLAKMIVVSPTGTPEFNAEIGKMHIVDFVVMTIPSLLFFIATFYYIFHNIKLLTGLTLDEVMKEDVAAPQKNENTKI